MICIEMSVNEEVAKKRLIHCFERFELSVSSPLNALSRLST